jgi:hypothetical protein
MKINKQSLQGKWVEYKPGVKFKIRPYSLFAVNIKPNVQDGDEIESAKSMFGMFDYSVMDWEGVFDENDEKLECTTENKQMFYEYVQDLAVWIFEQARNIRDEVVIPEEEVKN